MITNDSLVVTTQFAEHSVKWQRLLESGESVVVIFPRLSDRFFRIFQWTSQLNLEKYFPVHIDLQTKFFEESSDLEQFILHTMPTETQADSLQTSLHKLKKRIVLVISNGEALQGPQQDRIKYLLQQLLLTHSGSIVTLIAFETDVRQLFDNHHELNLLFQNILYYPLYPNDDIALFLNYLCRKWALKMPAPTRRSIASASGGSFWLAKEAARVYRENQTWDQSAESFQYRLSMLAKSFTDDEVVIMTAVPFISAFETTLPYRYLKQSGFITETNQLRIPALLPHIQRLTHSQELLQINHSDVEYKGVSLTHLLSPTEYSLLKLFISRPNTPIDRDTIAQIIWPTKTEDNFSQWAIDQAVKRLRDRLISLRLPPTTISSVRGVGYEYRTN